MQVNINYDLCLYKHSSDVDMSPSGVVYNCSHCEKSTPISKANYKELRKRKKARSIAGAKHLKYINS